MRKESRLTTRITVIPWWPRAAHRSRFAARIAKPTRPLQGPLDRLNTLAGAARRRAAQILAELGDDRGRFPTAACAASGPGLCPGNPETAGQ